MSRLQPTIRKPSPLSGRSCNSPTQLQMPGTTPQTVWPTGRKRNESQSSTRFAIPTLPASVTANQNTSQVRNSRQYAVEYNQSVNQAINQSAHQNVNREREMIANQFQQQNAFNQRNSLLLCDNGYEEYPMQQAQNMGQNSQYNSALPSPCLNPYQQQEQQMQQQQQLQQQMMQFPEQSQYESPVLPSNVAETMHPDDYQYYQSSPFHAQQLYAMQQQQQAQQLAQQQQQYQEQHYQNAMTLQQYQQHQNFMQHQANLFIQEQTIRRQHMIINRTWDASQEMQYQQLIAARFSEIHPEMESEHHPTYPGHEMDENCPPGLQEFQNPTQNMPPHMYEAEKRRQLNQAMIAHIQQQQQQQEFAKPPPAATPAPAAAPAAVIAHPPPPPQQPSQPPSQQSSHPSSQSGVPSGIKDMHQKRIATSTQEPLMNMAGEARRLQFIQNLSPHNFERGLTDISCGLNQQKFELAKMALDCHKKELAAVFGLAAPYPPVYGQMGQFCSESKPTTIVTPEQLAPFTEVEKRFMFDFLSEAYEDPKVRKQRMIEGRKHWQRYPFKPGQIPTTIAGRTPLPKHILPFEDTYIENPLNMFSELLTSKKSLVVESEVNREYMKNLYENPNKTRYVDPKCCVYCWHIEYAYCEALNLPIPDRRDDGYWRSHGAFTGDKTTCPAMRETMCGLCNATKDSGHDLLHCPTRPLVRHLSLPFY